MNFDLLFWSWSALFVSTPILIGYPIGRWINAREARRFDHLFLS